MFVIVLGYGSASAVAGDDPAVQSKAILDATGIRGGLIVHLGCRRRAAHGGLAGRTIASWSRDWIRTCRTSRRPEGTCNHAICTDPISVNPLASPRLPYADNLVNLVVAEDLGNVSAKEVLRVLAPLGVAYVRQDGKWSKTVKPWPKEIDEWTHYLHAADNNAVAQDSRVGPPRQMQWCCEPLWSRSHSFNSSICAMVSAKGRLFYIVDEGLTSITKAPIPGKMDPRGAGMRSTVFCCGKRPLVKWGSHEWKTRELRTVPKTVLRSLVAENDRVFVTLGYGDGCIDPRCGIRP